MIAFNKNAFECVQVCSLHPQIISSSLLKTVWTLLQFIFNFKIIALSAGASLSESLI